MKYLIALLLSCSTLMAVPPIGYNDPTIGGLVGWWTFNEGSGTNVYDYSGNNNFLTITNNTSFWTNGISLTGLGVNGTVLTAAYKLSSDYSFANSTFSVCAWAKTSATGEEVIISRGGWFGGWRLGFNTPGRNNLIYFNQLNAGNAYTAQVVSTNALNDGKWHFLSIVTTTSTIAASNCFANLWIDGVSNNTNFVGSSTYNPPSSGMGIGFNSGGNNYPFNGSIDDVRIYNRALSSDEILKLYNGGYGSQK